LKHSPPCLQEGWRRQDRGRRTTGRRRYHRLGWRLNLLQQQRQVVRGLNMRRSWNTMGSPRARPAPGPLRSRPTQSQFFDVGENVQAITRWGRTILARRTPRTEPVAVPAEARSSSTALAEALSGARQGEATFPLVVPVQAPRARASGSASPRSDPPGAEVRNPGWWGACSGI